MVLEDGQGSFRCVGGEILSATERTKGYKHV